MTDMRDSAPVVPVVPPDPAVPEGPAGDGRARRGVVAVLLALALLLTAAGCVAAMYTMTDRVAIGVAGLVLMLVLMALRVPVSVSMIATGLLGVLVLAGDRALESSLRDFPFRAAADWQLSVLPMFVLMGLVLWRSGVTGRVFRTAETWLSWMPGGLAIATNFAGAGMASASGSTMGISYALGRIAIPEMLRAGYDKRLATGVVTMAGTLGQLIPPSILLVVYAGVAQVPVGQQLIAALVPGLLVAVAYALAIFAQVVHNPAVAPRHDRGFTWSQRWSSLAGIWPMPLLLLVVIGGLYSGLFTATEAGAVAAAVAIVVALVIARRGLLRNLWDSLRDTVIAIGSIMFLLVGVGILNRFLALSGVATALAEWIDSLFLGRVWFLLLLVVFYLVLGTFMEPIGMILLTVPVFAPTLAALDIDLAWFGVFMVIMGEIAIISPPVGVLLFIVFQIARDPEVNLGHDIRMADILRGTVPFLLAALGIVLLMIFAPGLTELLSPSLRE